jgi:hypothetical protein
MDCYGNSFTLTFVENINIEGSILVCLGALIRVISAFNAIHATGYG